ncbi:MAG: pyridoxal-phosphate dependent enzyme [Chloroflexi bacterium]|nr:pyridoxal-phosphate dependent enzyme [Chloroflexota bacterium]
MSSPSGLTCLRCSTSYPAEEIVTGCPKCRAEGVAVNLKVTYPNSAFRTVQDSRGFDSGERGVLRYHDLLPISLAHATWLGEGETPLIHAGALGELVGLEHLYLKNETRNPTGSYKDRMAAVIVARAREAGATTVTIASSGNAGAALAAYATVAGLRCVIFTSESAPLAVKAQMRALGAQVVALSSSPQRWTIMAQAIERYGWYAASNYQADPVGSNPYGVEAYKTVAFEVWEQLGRDVPDVMALPVCYGDGLAGTARGFVDLQDLGFTRRVPRLVAGEVWGPLTHAQANNLEAPVPAEAGPTVAFSIGGGRSTYQALHALTESEGRAVTVTDEELLHWQRELGRREGIYAEASSLASVAALAKLRAEDRLRPSAVSVALLTATGLKDPGAGGLADDVPLIEPTLESLASALTSAYGIPAAEL